MKMTTPASDIRSWLRRYLSAEVSLTTFAERFTQSAWSLSERDGDSEDELVYEIELRLAEFSNGDWTESELRDLLRPVATTYVVGVAPSAVTLKTGSASTTVYQSVSFGVRSAGRAHDMARA